MKAGVAAIADQAWLSVLNLAISLCFIHYAEKQVYGVYLLLLTPLLLIQGIQNALILSPTSTILPSTEGTERERTERSIVALNITFGILASVLGAAGVFAYAMISEDGGVGLPTALAFGLCVLGVVAREAARNLSYAKAMSAEALGGDLLYGVLLLSTFGALVWTECVTVEAALVATGTAALAAQAWRVDRKVALHLDQETAQRVWACGRWALIGAVVAWVNLSAYPLVVGVRLDVEAVADINAARLFLTPIAVGITGWSNFMRPTISRLAHRNEMDQVATTTARAVAAGVGMTAVYAALLLWLYPNVEPLLGPQYHGLQSLSIVWSLYFAVSLARTLYMATLMTDERGYKELQSIGWISLVIATVGLWFITPLGKEWVVSLLAMVEILQLTIIFVKARKRWGTYS